MTLLLDFLCRLGWGMAVALCLTPTAVVPAGFFRVNLLVVLGLATFAALLAGTQGGPPGWLLAGGAVAAWCGSIAWYGQRIGAGRVCCLVTAMLLAAATTILAPASFATAGGRLVSGAVLGLTMHAMLLGHWYLNAPGMRVDVLRRTIDQTLLVWGLQLVGVVLVSLMPAEPTPTAGQTVWAFTALRWLAGIIGLPVLLVMARKTLDIPNTQSATGILYVACLAVILGELTAQLIQQTQVGGESSPPHATHSVAHEHHL